MRHIYEHSALAGRIAAHIVLDGPGADAAVTQALGSRRYQVAITGPGGHSFTDAGTPNPIAALAIALAALAETPLPDEPRTTLNFGTIHGGISVNSIPESAQANIDFRSTDPDQLLRLEVALHRAVEDAVDALQSPGMARRNQVRRNGSALPLVLRGLQNRRPPRRATARRFPAARPRCALSTAISACAPIFASAQPTPTSRSLLAFLRCQWAPAAKAAPLTRCTNGIQPRTANLPSSACSCCARHAGVGRGPIRV